MSAGERREGGGLTVVDGRNEREDLLSSLRYHCKYQRVRGCDGGEGYEDWPDLDPRRVGFGACAQRGDDGDIVSVAVGNQIDLEIPSASNRGGAGVTHLGFDVVDAVEYVVRFPCSQTHH